MNNHGLSRRVFGSIVLNVILAVFFVLGNQWALIKQWEETFVWLAVCYGCIAIVGNALYISLQKSA